MSIAREAELCPKPRVPGVEMALPEDESHSFIIRVWLEDAARQGRPALWRGHITHVPGGERRSVQDLDAITAFIAPYLEAMGVDLGLTWRLRQVLCPWQRRARRRR